VQRLVTGTLSTPLLTSKEPGPDGGHSAVTTEVCAVTSEAAGATSTMSAGAVEAAAVAAAGSSVLMAG
jgi:hypothetical protein